LPLCSADFLNLLAFTFKANHGDWNMTNMNALIVMMCMTGLSPLAFAQSATPPRIAASEAKKHAGETVTVCGKVVDTKIPKYGLAGRGKPVTFDLDQPEPKPVFFFVAFGSHEGGPKEAVAAYQGKRVCVTGKIETTAEPALPFIMAADRSQIKPQAEGK
jgi:hypothetical protein